MKIKSQLIYILLFFSGYTVFAQGTDGQNKKEETQSQIDPTNIVIEKNKELSVPKASKIFVTADESEADKKDLKVNYTIPQLEIKQLPALIPIRPLKISPEKIEKLYGNFIKAGFGNYSTPYLKVLINNKRNNNLIVGGSFLHNSSGKGPEPYGKNAAFGNTDLELNAKYMDNGYQVGGKFIGSTDTYHYYGYNPSLEVDKKDIKQNYNNLGLQVDFGSYQEKKDFNFNLKAKANRFNSKFDDVETQVGLEGHADWNVNDEQNLQVDFELWHSKLKDNFRSDTRNLFQFTPSYYFHWNDFRIRAGVTVAYEDDTLADNQKDLRFFPVVFAEYDLKEMISVYAGISGGVDKQTYQNYVSENPYLGTGLDIRQQIKTFELDGGIRGQNQNYAYSVGFRAGSYLNMGFYKNSDADTSRFEIVYNNDAVAVFNFYANGRYQFNENGNVQISMDVFNYGLDELLGAWHKPTYKFDLVAQYNLFDKVHLGLGAYYLGQIETINPASDTIAKLDNIFDVNAQISYLFSPRFSAFIEGYNLLNKDYQRYLNYSNKKVQVLAGLTYSF
ncbi:TonB-dependent receptor [Marinigracilibium pacificum]|uniref:TonB-dependent receptor n=1 Tax=Marinigracilibium pacificum TaxID=2729599 RepID=A0A848IZ37_9BACT|nr:TonB-dependent receptor [Marinigracilibium pacificum]NMM48408.1 hypothetical protein [Marinigracilibium pacificum]